MPHSRNQLEEGVNRKEPLDYIADVGAPKSEDRKLIIYSSLFAIRQKEKYTNNLTK